MKNILHGVLCFILLPFFLTATAQQVTTPQRIAVPRQLAARPIQQGIRLQLSKKSVMVGEPVTLQAFLNRPIANASVTLSFGDGSPAFRGRDRSSVIHHFSAAGTFILIVNATTGREPRLSVYSDTTRITVTDIPLVVDHRTTMVDSLVSFGVRWISADTNVWYRLSFGDRDTSEWSSSPDVQHRYSRRGTYNAQAEIIFPGIAYTTMRTVPRVYKTEIQQVVVRTPERPPVDTLSPPTIISQNEPPVASPPDTMQISSKKQEIAWLPWIVAIALLGGGAFLVRNIVSTRKTSKPPKVHSPAVIMTVNPYTGKAQMRTDRAIGITVTIGLNPHSADATLRCESQQNLIKNRSIRDA